MAITSVESYALRRAAIGLGDRLGLGLYNKGALTPLVKGTLQTFDEESPTYIEPPETQPVTLQQAAASLAASAGAQVVDSGSSMSGEGAPSVDQYAEGASEE